MPGDPAIEGVRSVSLNMSEDLIEEGEPGFLLLSVKNFEKCLSFGEETDINHRQSDFFRAKFVG